MELERPGKKEFVYLQIAQNNTKSIATKNDMFSTPTAPRWLKQAPLLCATTQCQETGQKTS